MPNRTSHRCLACLCAAVLAAVALPPAPGFAQPEPTPQPWVQEPLISIDFPGGTLRECIEAIREAAAPEPVNIFLPSDSEYADLPVPPFRLRDVTIGAALDAVSGMPIQQGDSFIHLNVGKRAPGAGRTIYSISVSRRTHMSRSDAAARLREPSQVLVLQTASLTRPLPGDPSEAAIPAETVLSAIEAAVEVAAGADSGTEIRYHEASGLVLLSGPERALQAARAAVREIEAEAHNRREHARRVQQLRGWHDPRGLEDQLEEYVARMRRTQIQAELASQRVQLAEQDHAEVKTLFEGGNASQAQVRDATLRLATQRAELAEIEIELDRSQQRIERLRRDLERARQLSAGAGNVSDLDVLRAENRALRERLAAAEAQIANLRTQLEGAQTPARGGGGGGGGG